MVTKTRKLTDKETKYVHCILKGEKQREAYKNAGYKADKMSKRILDRKASEVFNRKPVQELYRSLNDKVIKNSESESILSAQEVLKELTSIALDDVSNYLEFKNEIVQIGFDNDGNPKLENQMVIKMKDSNLIDTKNIQEIRIGKDGQFFFKLYSREAALSKLGRHYKLFTDKVETNLDMEVVVKLDGQLEDWSM